MANSSAETKISLPRIKRVALERFDLYSNLPNAEVTIERPVFCLIGANGLGKSTFLNTVNYAITGAVPDPKRNFQSAADYAKHASRIDRTEDYFGGRIREISRPMARATVELAWPSSTMVVTRDIFEGSAVNKLAISDDASVAPKVLSVADGHDPDELSGIFKAEILKRTRLNDFSQFIFILHFISTFDEGRHLLLWDDNALTNALYLAFGADPEVATKADKLRREMDRAASRGRNIRFSARHVEERIDQLVGFLKGNAGHDITPDEQLKAQHDTLIQGEGEASTRLVGKQSELREADLKWAQLSSSLTESQLEYRRLFSERLRRSSVVEHHPAIRATISEDHCAICGTNHVKERLQRIIDEGLCPLCGSAVEPASAADTAISELRRLDGNIIRIRDELSAILKTRERLFAEVKASEALHLAASDSLVAFERKETNFLAKAKTNTEMSTIATEIEKLKQEKANFQKQSADHYAKRDQLRESLRTLEMKLKAQYDAAAVEFVPRFRALAQEFIGLPIDIELEHRRGANIAGFGLRLRMDDQVRTTSDKLSESQRFFLDIALRMALTEVMTDSPTALLIDTPEGSLDVAYEARAGAMFSKFIGSGNAILMTANLRSSELVLRLAKLQQRAGMQIIRMTEWTELSKVQQAEEQLFQQAYEAIESALN